MYPTKPGGGNKEQPFKPNDGEYTILTDEEKTKLFDDDMDNIVRRYLLGKVNDTHYPRFPIFGIHNDDYAKLYVEKAICKIYKDIPYEKITNYLLKYREKDDKSYFFNYHGYSLNNYSELFKQIYEGSDFSKMKFQKWNEFGITVGVPTIIHSCTYNKDIIIVSYWITAYENDQMHFVTVNLNKKEIKKWIK